MLHYIKKRVNKNVNHITEYISKEMQKIYTENYETSMEYQLYHAPIPSMDVSYTYASISSRDR